MNVNGNLNPFGNGSFGLGSGTNAWTGIVTRNIYTNQTDSGTIGSTSYYWHDIYAGTYHYHDTSTLQHFDEYDDLAIAKQWGSREASFSMLRTKNENGDVTEFYDGAKLHTFELDCIKRVALKLDEYDASFAEISKLKQEVANLQTELATLKGKHVVD